MVEKWANAKINLSIDVLRKRTDGYHDVKMIMQSIDLCDYIRVNKSNAGINIKCDNGMVPCNESNIVYKVTKLFLEKYNIYNGVDIYIEKNIPVAAGLAGGSTDGASCLVALNEMFEVNATIEELKNIGAKIGADIPFCIEGGTVIAEGVGEILTPMTKLKSVNIVLAKPRIEVSTPWVYNNLDLNNMGQRPDNDTLLKNIHDNDWYEISKNMRNVLESVTIKTYQIIQEIKDKMYEFGANGALMSGSGPTVFGVFINDMDFDKIKEYFDKLDIECHITKTI